MEKMENSIDNKQTKKNVSTLMEIVIIDRYMDEDFFFIFLFGLNSFEQCAVAE